MFKLTREIYSENNLDEDKPRVEIDVITEAAIQRCS